MANGLFNILNYDPATGLPAQQPVWGGGPAPYSNALQEAAPETMSGQRMPASPSTGGSPFMNAKGEGYVKNIPIRDGVDLEGLSPRAQDLVRGLGRVGIDGLSINSAFRSPTYNANVGGANKSQHINGNAIDIDISRLNPEQKTKVLEEAVRLGVRGVGIYPSGNSLHLDVRETPALWGGNPSNAYAGHGPELAPEWARPIVSNLLSGRMTGSKMEMGASSRRPVVDPVERAPLPPIPEGFRILDEAAAAPASIPQGFRVLDESPNAQVASRFGGMQRPSNAAALKDPLQATADAALVGPAGPGNYAKTFASNAANTALLNIPRNIQAGIESYQTGQGFDESYNKIKEREAALNRQNPKTAIAGDVAGIVGGAVALPGIGGGATMAARAGRAAVTAGGYSAASEAIDSKDPINAAIAGGVGAVAGAVLSPVAEKVAGWLTRNKADPSKFLKQDGTLTDDALAAAQQAGIAPEDMTAGLQKALADAYTQKGTSPAVSREALANEFNIPLSKAQATGDFAASQYEQAAAKNAFGPQAQRVAGDFFEGQGNAVKSAKQGIQEELAGGRDVINSPSDAGNIIANEVRQTAAKAKEGYNQLYDKALSQPGTFEKSTFDNLGGKIKDRLFNRDNPVLIDDLTPAANRALQDIDRVSALKPQTAADETVGVNLKSVDRARKLLVQRYKTAESATDKAAVRQIMNEFDNHLEDAFTAGLFNGSDKALPALKEARAAFAKYQKDFKPSGAGDDAGANMRRIIERDATGNDIANLLMNSAGSGAKGSAVRTANKLKEILGADSEGFNAVRQGVWQRLTSKPEGVEDFGPQALSTNIMKFINGDGKELANKIFTAEEIGKIRRFANVLKDTVPPKGSVNTSGSGYVLAAMQSAGLGTLGGGIDWLSGGSGVAGIGAGVGLGGLRMGGTIAKNFYKGRAAEKYFSQGVPKTPVAPSPLQMTISPKAGVGAGLGAAQGF